MLEIEHVSVSYGPVPALRGVSIEVPEGSITAIVGPNGAGKSSCLKAVSGLVPCTAGQIRLRGRPIQHLPAEERVHLAIAHVLEGRRLFGDQTVEDNLRLGAFALSRRGTAGGEIERHIQAIYQRFPRLAERRRQLAMTMSGGEQQMLAIAVALMSRPRLLLLDEPSLGLAPKIVEEVFDLVRQLRDEGITILLVEQMASIALTVADMGYVLHRGQVASHGPAVELLREMKLKEAYFGRG